jgi:hypothetical protein
LAETLKVDTAMLSKMERGERFFRKEDVEILATVFGESKEQLLTLWLADKILKTAKREKYGKEALKLAIENVEPANFR